MHIPPSEDSIPKELFGQVWRQYGSEEVAPSDRGRAKRKKPRAGARLVRKDSVQRVGAARSRFYAKYGISRLRILTRDCWSQRHFVSEPVRGRQAYSTRATDSKVAFAFQEMPP